MLQKLKNDLLLGIEFVKTVISNVHFTSKPILDQQADAEYDAWVRSLKEGD